MFLVVVVVVDFFTKQKTYGLLYLLWLAVGYHNDNRLTMPDSAASAAFVGLLVCPALALVDSSSAI